MFPESGTLNNYEITIQLSLDGFSFVIYNVNNHIFTDIEHFSKPVPSLRDALAEIQEMHNCDIADFARLTVLFDNSANTFVPASIFQNQAKGKYLDFLGIGKENRTPVSDFVSAIEANNVYAISSDDAKILTNIQTDTRFRHATSVLVTSVIRDNIHKSGEPVIHLNIKSPKFDMVVIKGCNLLFHNTFSFKTKEDFLYFLLFSIDQLHIDAGTVPVYFSGMIEEKSQLVELASRYIRDIRFVRRDNRMTFAEEVEETPYYYNYTLFNSAICEL